MERTYRAILDNGHDFFDVVFSSEFRAGSRANELDCYRMVKKRLGRSVANSCVIKSIFLED